MRGFLAKHWFLVTLALGVTVALTSPATVRQVTAHLPPAAIIAVVAGQLLVSTVVDQFGWLGAMGRPMDPTRAVGLAVVLLGVWLTVK